MPFKKGEIAPGATPFKKGVIHNPLGRPKGQTNISAALAKVMDWTVAKLYKTEIQAQIAQGKLKLDKLLLPKKVAHALAVGMVKHALAGDVRMMQLVLERYEGKVPDRIAGPDGEPLGLTQQQINAYFANPEAMAQAQKLAEYILAPKLPAPEGLDVVEEPVGEPTPIPPEEQTKEPSP